MGSAASFIPARIALALLLMALGTRLPAALPLEPPEAFFTDLADRLLQQQLGMRLSEVQIAPTNQYDSAVHRILQVTANIFDATSTNEMPTVFRPLFNVTSNGVFLGGFTNDNRVSTLQPWLDSNPYGIPMVIAARKGIPNFNEFTMRTDFLMQRKLQLMRANTSTRPHQTNQMYLLSVSNFVAAEVWNSSEGTLNAQPLALLVSNQTTLWMSNAAGLQTNASFSIATQTNVPANSWTGGFRTGFVLPLMTNQAVLANAVYRFSDNTFANTATNAFEASAGFPLPDWVCAISNRLIYVLADGDRLLDFVILNTSQATDLHHDLIETNPYGQIPGGISATIAGVWNTNRASNPSAPTFGILGQLDIGLGNFTTSATDWRAYGLSQALTETAKNNLIDSFRVFCGLMPLSGSFVTNNSLTMETPLNPAAKLAVMSTWQANDPLVHYHVSDLELGGAVINRQFLKPSQPGTNFPPSSLGFLNTRYSPWGGNPYASYENPGAYDRSGRDPGVYSPDDWNFPTNETLSTRWLGRVHRGTPWQTIYLKADAAPLNLWTNQSSDLQIDSAGRRFSRTHPTNDWRLVALLASLLNTNDAGALTSINTTNVAACAAAFAGLLVLSNSATSPILGSPPQYETNVVAPDAPQVAIICDAIQRARLARRGAYFPSVGDFLSVPELSSASPWLNLAGDQPRWGLTDEAYEALPAQLLERVSADSVGTAIWSHHAVLLQFSAADGFGYHIESTSDFMTWTAESGVLYGTNGGFAFEPPPTNGVRFYRAVLAH